jgi:hypothetical protein
VFTLWYPVHLLSGHRWLSVKAIFTLVKSTSRKFLVHLEGTLSSRISPWQRVGHFENCNDHSAGISHLSLTADPYLSPNLRKKLLFSASALHWVMHSEWGTHAIRVSSGLHLGWVLISGMPPAPRAVPYVQLTFLNSTVSKREWLICKMKKTQREYDRKSYTQS